MDERELLTQIDACHAGGDALRAVESAGDLAELSARIEADPVVRGLYARVQAMDVSIGAAYRDVPVPAGLADRILAQLAAAKATGSATTGAAVSVQPARGGVDAAIASAEAHEPVHSAATVAGAMTAASAGQRRWNWSWTAAGLAASLLVAVIAWQALRPAPITSAALPERAVQFFGQDARERLAAPPAAEYPLSQQITRRSGATRRGISGFLGHDGAAYDLRYRKVKATVYVVRVVVDGLPSNPPPQSDGLSGGYAVGAWQEGELLYVLVVAGGDREYRRFVEPLGGVARLEPNRSFAGPIFR